MTSFYRGHTSVRDESHTDAARHSPGRPQIYRVLFILLDNVLHFIWRGCEPGRYFTRIVYHEFSKKIEFDGII